MRRIADGRNIDEMTIAYVENGPKMLKSIEENTPLQMILLPSYPDYRAELPGGKAEGRYLLPDPFNLAMSLSEAEQRFPFLDKVRKAPVSLQLGLPEGIWAGGRTLLGPLVLGCLERGVEIKTGGFEWNEEMKKQFMHGTFHAFTCPSNEGDGQIMGMEIGAAVSLMDQTVILPTIRVPGEKIDGKPLYRLFLVSCGKPGDIIVNRYGKRCCNESFYLDMGPAFNAYDRARSEYINTPMYWIADQSHRDEYFCGPLAPEEPVPSDAEWIECADTIKELAEKLALPADQLAQTVERFNHYAKEGKDPDFHRGEMAYDRSAGDPNHEPNASLGPIIKPPFYGARIYSGTAGTQGGLVTNSNAQVKDVKGNVIPGFYATSNATAQLAIGSGYNSGFANAQSMVFGYIAANHMANSKE